MKLTKLLIIVISRVTGSLTVTHSGLGLRRLSQVLLPMCVAPFLKKFSPNNLMFGHRVCGSLALLCDCWRETDPLQNLLEYVNNFRYGLYKAQKVAQRKLAAAQGNLKKLYDR